MLFRKFLATTIATALLVAAPAVAQGPEPTLEVSESTLHVGDTVTITYFNPLLAGQTIQIDVDDGRRRDPHTDAVSITLDATGHGTANWTVPDWSMAKFNGPDVGEVFCTVSSDSHLSCSASRSSSTRLFC